VKLKIWERETTTASNIESYVSQSFGI